ncbi:hypothetical protein [Methylococcus mesophilus]|uniref:hypothetical protein n=1 Tax=Methylococcus mesophilus TaxID=2993564 RepID=UPI00224AEE4A|nr:hypothetical protein [Methylococcus mesophilus]UZR29066.1 hypothetical protein OOT43_00135 [Methylococcus mesophilus]
MAQLEHEPACMQENPWRYNHEREDQWEQEKRAGLIRYGATHAEAFAPILARWEAEQRPIAKGLREALRQVWKRAQGAA